MSNPAPQFAEVNPSALIVPSDPDNTVDYVRKRLLEL
jgi:hypothetical protein